jgi:hypothetical protein
MAAWSLTPAVNGEGLQVLRYNGGEKYDAHWVGLVVAEGGRGAALALIDAPAAASPR